MTRVWCLTLAAALSAASLTACSGSEPAAVENEAAAAVPSPTEDLAPAPAAAQTQSPAPVVEPVPAENSMAEVPSEEAPAPDEQMMDDAAATGMTARATRDDPGAAEEPVERK